MKTLLTIEGVRLTISDEDFEKALAFRWRTHVSGRNWYAISQGNGHKLVYLHRLIAGAKRGEVVDHINGDTLDNRRENLRIVTQSQNCQNKRKKHNSSSRFKGVTRRGDKWSAAYKSSDGKHVYLGTFETEEGAARAYDEAAARDFGKHARLNFK